MLNETTRNALIAILVILVLAALVTTSWQILKERIVRWLERKGRIEKGPIRATRKRLKIASTLYSIALLSLVFSRLPALTRTVSPQMKEVIDWGLIIITLLFGAGYNVMEGLMDKQAKEKGREAPGTPSNIALDRRPRS